MKNAFLVLGLFSALLFAGCTDQNVATSGDAYKAPAPAAATDTQIKAPDATTPPAADTTAASKDATTATTPADTTKDSTNPTETMTTDQTAAPKKGDTVATIVTDLGTIKFKLFTKEVPEMTKNFIELSKQGKYKNTPFHRVIKDFMIQTGDFNNKNGTGGYSYKGPNTKLDDEIVPTLKHLYGTVSMANAGPNTNGSQFFIVTNKKGTAFLDGSYTIFGQVYEGMDVVEKIQALQVEGTEKPSKTVNITKTSTEVVK